MFVVTLILLILVFIPGIGLKLGGAYRWINFGFISIQPSEIAKLTFIIYLAAWLDSRQKVIADWRQGLAPFVLLLLVMGFLLIRQPDMGTLVVISLIAGIMLFGAGVPIGQLVIGSIGAAAVFLILVRSSNYRWQRFLTFLNPQLDILGAGYQINQSLLAIGSGGWLGVGFGQSLQKYLYLPQPHIDAILAIIVEEMGFARTLILIGIFVVLGLRGIAIARLAPDNFGRLIALGIIGWIIGQGFLNMAAVFGSIPLTGIPLPFIAFGGTALVTLMVGVGILLNISKHTTK
jgi:cell division protein FtsW